MRNIVRATQQTAPEDSLLQHSRHLAVSCALARVQRSHHPAISSARDGAAAPPPQGRAAGSRG
eukprot:4549867-Alexandrium_andersonii.AAC.1